MELMVPNSGVSTSHPGPLARWPLQLAMAAGLCLLAACSTLPAEAPPKLDLPPAFTQGQGPLLATYGEYDAVPGNCQAATTCKMPRDGLSRFAPGHTDPHSALGISALGGVLAAKAANAMARVGAWNGWICMDDSLGGARPGPVSRA